MNCKTCNKLSCMDCVTELEKQLEQAQEAIEALTRGQNSLENINFDLKAENTALKAEIEEWRHSQDMSFKAVEEADKEARKYKKALEMVFSDIPAARLQEICEAERDGW